MWHHAEVKSPRRRKCLNKCLKAITYTGGQNLNRWGDHPWEMRGTRDKRAKEDTEGWWAVIVIRIVTEGGETKQQTYSFAHFFYIMCICTHVDITLVIRCLISLSLPSANPDPMKHVEIIGHLVVLSFCLYEGSRNRSSHQVCVSYVQQVLSHWHLLFIFWWGEDWLSHQIWLGRWAASSKDSPVSAS